MGSGKTALAKAYAARFDLTVFDADEEFSRRYGEINAFFERDGESAFRKLEAEIIKTALASNAEVIACGGGVVERKANMTALKAECDIVYLYADKDVLFTRIQNSARPLKERAAELYENRKPLYERYADYSVYSGGTADEGLAEVIKAVAAPRKNRYDVLLCDADDTVLDFQAAMKFTIVESAHEIGVKADDADVIKEYEKILPDVWGRLERGEITREKLAMERFDMLKNALGEEFDSAEFNDAYMKNIKITRFVIDGALEFLDKVRSRGIKVYIITNSDKAVASQRLKALDGHIDGAFVSEDVGYDKPDTRFFERVYSCVGYPDKARVLVFGDGVNSDIHGGAAFGVDTCLYDPQGKKHSAEADFTARSYADVLRIL